MLGVTQDLHHYSVVTTVAHQLLMVLDFDRTQETMEKQAQGFDP